MNSACVTTDVTRGVYDILRLKFEVRDGRVKNVMVFLLHANGSARAGDVRGKDLAKHDVSDGGVNWVGVSVGHLSGVRNREFISTFDIDSLNLPWADSLDPRVGCGESGITVTFNRVQCEWVCDFTPSVIICTTDVSMAEVILGKGRKVDCRSSEMSFVKGEQVSSDRVRFLIAEGSMRWVRLELFGEVRRVKFRDRSREGVCVDEVEKF